MPVSTFKTERLQTATKATGRSSCASSRGTRYEIVCVLRYKRHHYMAKGIHSQAVAEEFLEHAAKEQGHADQIAERITQLDGEPNFNPEGMLTRSHSEYVEGETLVDMIREDLVAERIAVEILL